MTVLVSQTVDELGQPISAQEKFDAYSEASLRAEYLTLGIELKSFLKTKVNGMPRSYSPENRLTSNLGSEQLVLRK